MPLGFSGLNLLTLHGFITATALFTYVITTHLRHQRRHPSAAVAWILFILLVPYIALPSYLIFGSRKLKRMSAGVPLSETMQSENRPWAIATALALQQPGPMEYRRLVIQHDGAQALNALLDVVNQATHSIDICTYILRNDEVGAIIIDRLCQKAVKGVQVRLLLDGFSNWNFFRPDLRKLKQAGGQYALFVPPLGSSLKGRTNLRNHRKLAIADGKLANARMWIGGRNLGAEYFHGVPPAPAWRDLSFDVSGAIAWQAKALFDSDWNFATGNRTTETHNLLFAETYDNQGAQLIASGPDQIDDTVYSLLVTAAYQSQERILLVSPYFVPDSALLMALCLAARRGVKVDLLIPKKSNHPISDFARNRSIRSLSQAGASVWLSDEMQHGKLAIFDNVLALAGSANIDNRSLFINYELMVAFHAERDVNRFAKWFYKERTNATLYGWSKPGLLRDLAEGMTLWVGFQL
jgi:cardiolipin synthase A/B